MQNEQNESKQGAVKQLVVFKLQNEDFGIDIQQVREVLKLSPITPVPHSAAFLEGVINVRGTITPVVDLRRRFELAGKENTDETRIIIVDINEEQVGLMVDAVTEVLRIEENLIHPPPAVVSNTESELIEGIARYNDRLIILLKTDNLLTSEEQLILDDLKVDQVEL